MMANSESRKRNAEQQPTDRDALRAWVRDGGPINASDLRAGLTALLDDLDAAERESVRTGHLAYENRVQTERAERAEAQVAANAATIADLRDRLAAVDRQGAEWVVEGQSLVRNAYSGGDVHEGQTLQRCADRLRRVLAGEGGEG